MADSHPGSHTGSHAVSAAGSRAVSPGGAQQRPADHTGGSSRPAGPGQAPHVENDHENHGESPAAWIAVSIVLVGALVMSVAVVIASRWLFVVGVVLAVAGGISGKLLSMLGFGASAHPADGSH